MKKISKNLKRKETTAFFAMVALFSGIIFSTKGMTGNMIISRGTIDPISLIGIILIVCSIIMGVYTISIKRK